MPAQLKRLLIIFAIFIGLFLVVRHFLVPDSWGQYGYYRGDALIDNMDKEKVFASSEDCGYCHDDILNMISTDSHAGISCLSCHGPGLEHIDNPESTNITKESSRDFCGRCHSLNPARPDNIIVQVDITTHHTERTNCIDCHNPHQVWELKE